MNPLTEELLAGIPDLRGLTALIIRLLFAIVLGAILGAQREHRGKPAGLRTHMLVSLGAALFVIAAIQSGMDNEALSRLLQGLVAGIGFLGAGAILKLQREREVEVEGLTTAAGLWLTAAVGVAVGLGRLGLATIAMILAWIIMSVLGRIEHRINARRAEIHKADATHEKKAEP
jgi:putative Mg2+ transporter-C (MgtC) family protein